LNKPKERLVTPDDPTIQAVLDQVEKHSELILSRREIIKYVLSEDGARSKDVQALLKLDDLEQIRSVFTSSANSLAKDEKSAESKLKAAKNDFQRHLNIQDLVTDEILDSINEKRRLLNLTELAELTADTNINAENIRQNGSVPPFSRATALSDLATLTEHIESSQGQAFLKGYLLQLDTLKQDPTLLAQIKRANFYQQGLNLLTEDDDACPFCDTEWEIASLIARLKTKLETAQAAQKTNENLNKAARKLQEYIQRLIDLLNKAVKIAQAVDKEQESASLSEWIVVLSSISRKLTPIDALLDAEEEVRNFWQRILHKITDEIFITHAAVSARPDNSAELEARDFLTIAQERLQQYRVAQYEFERQTQASFAAKTALNAYNNAVEEKLGGLYAQVESKLADYYGFINQEDEAQFSAKLEPKKASLIFEVDFYNRGLFPPAAYHSEGHQDSMGLCLYLALMQQLMQGELSFVVLDDVVMSVDIQHRREVCRLFKERFPSTQFILTTHEQAWHRQMVAHGLISKKSSITFRNWTVEHGPLAEESPEVWVEIDDDLQNNNVSAAAAKLRRHLEYIAREIAERLRAQVTFQGDGNYDLGGLLPPALSRITKYLKDAKNAARSWKDDEAENRAQVLLENFEAKQKAVNMEQWAINTAVHYNPWENFSKEDFIPVVEAYKELLSLIHCEKCETWLYVSPLKGNAESFRCTCAQINFNLKSK
jgi:predicted RNA-binding protein Jag